jgi:hypothetical protein
VCEAREQIDDVKRSQLLCSHVLVLHGSLNELAKVFDRRLAANERFGHSPPTEVVDPHLAGAKGIPSRL